MKSNLIAVLLLLAFFTFTQAAPKDCTSSEKEKADSCFVTLFVYGDRSRKGWSTESKDYENTCQLFRQQHQCIKSYAKRCLAPFSKQIVGILLRGITTQIKIFCGPTADREKLMSRAVCGNEDIENSHKCIDDFVKVLKGTMSLPVNERMPMCCCSFHTLTHCVLDKLAKRPSCRKEDIKFYKRILTGVVGDALDLACSNYKDDGSNVCKEQERIALKIKKDDSEGKSIFIPLMNILNSL